MSTEEADGHVALERVREIVAVVVLSLTAILTTWCGFGSSKWSGQMSIQFSQASSARIQSVDQRGDDYALLTVLFALVLV
ncbi:hypothetical protein UQW22_07980 [Isoptericola halotolerans]|uniref:hypothetical protein n=1 Tax=Isoptericola halotolerans TaxID=300560 RepID=UPI003890EEB1